MKISFNIPYLASWGESLYVVGSIPQLGKWDEAKALKMKIKGSDQWHVEIEADNAEVLEYGYLVKNDHGTSRREWGEPRKLSIPKGADFELVLEDKWSDQPWDKPFYSQPFKECVFPHKADSRGLKLQKQKLLLIVEAPQIRIGDVVAVSGSTAELGAWDESLSVDMKSMGEARWGVEIPITPATDGSEYKYLIKHGKTGQLVAWENGENRKIHLETDTEQTAVVISGDRLNNPQKQWRGAGTAIPVFSLRSKEDNGVGDFMDLKGIVDWAKATGQNFIQVLPINDTTMTGTWTDSYPYNANSTFALHPMFLRLEAMGHLANAGRMDYYKRASQELNGLKEVDYERVNKIKAEYTRELFDQIGTEVLDSQEFKKFYKKNEEWLEPYAAFCVLRDIHGTAEMDKWGEYAQYNRAKVQAFASQHLNEINCVYFTQYFLDKQLSEVRDYAHSQGVALKGDIPIGISRNSVDAWVNPRLFNLDCQAGAPPDAFSTLGQNWGFPTYNWEEMSRDGFAWWKARFRKMAEYFDAYRIDHVLGFFRIWQIPMDAVHGLLGVFHPALPFDPDELRYSYDFWLDVNLQTTPYIMDWFLGDFFGEYADEVHDRFLEPLGAGRFKIKEQWDTQRKVVNYFDTLEQNDKNNKIRDGLLGLIDQVLFIPDPYDRNKYHPRIAAQHTYIYRALNDYEKYCFDRLYNDFFYRRNNDFWYGKAMWKLPPLIDATQMLVCAEDLGMIPDCVPAVMRKLEILTLEIQRMPKDPKEPFGNTWDYPYYSVCTTSTHDMDGIRRWWEEDAEVTQRYYNQVLHCGGKAPTYAEPWICDKIVQLHLDSPAMLCILPLQDWLSMDGDLRRNDPREELINVPANPRHYWRYRMHIDLEDLLKQDKFNQNLAGKIQQSGR